MRDQGQIQPEEEEEEEADMCSRISIWRKGDVEGWDWANSEESVCFLREGEREEDLDDNFTSCNSALI